MLLVFYVVCLWARHPDGLDDLEYCRADAHEDKKSNQLGTDGVFIICFGSFLHISPLRNIFGILLIGLPHLGCARHLEAVCWNYIKYKKMYEEEKKKDISDDAR